MEPGEQDRKKLNIFLKKTKLHLKLLWEGTNHRLLFNISRPKETILIIFKRPRR